MRTIDSELRKSLESLGKDGALTVIISPKEYPESQKGESREETRRINQEACRLSIKPITDYLDGEKIRYNALGSIGLVTACMKAEEVYRLSEQPFIGQIIGDSKIELIQ